MFRYFITIEIFCFIFPIGRDTNPDSESNGILQNNVEETRLF